MSYFSEPNQLPSRPKPGDHLVGAEQDPVLVADRADTFEVALRRRERAAGVLDRLHDHHRDCARARLFDGVARSSSRNAVNSSSVSSAGRW